MHSGKLYRDLHVIMAQNINAKKVLRKTGLMNRETLQLNKGKTNFVPELNLFTIKPQFKNYLKSYCMHVNHFWMKSQHCPRHIPFT